MKSLIKKIPKIKNVYLFYRSAMRKQDLFKKIILFKRFLKDYKRYGNINANKNFISPESHLKPCLFDKTDDTPIEPTYFYQDSWCARKIFENKPKRHYDIGSKAEMVGIISQFVPTTMVDIRSINLELDGLSFRKGDILSLPFKDNSLESISSICVIEHIGLGRYGDKLDPFGSEKAIAELKRVLAFGGSLYISLPVDAENIIYFNAHRAFTRDYILKLFKPLKLIEEKYIYKTSFLEKNYSPEKGFGTGLFYFKKI